MWLATGIFPVNIDNSSRHFRAGLFTSSFLTQFGIQTRWPLLVAISMVYVVIFKMNIVNDTFMILLDYLCSKLLVASNLQLYFHGKQFVAMPPEHASRRNLSEEMRQGR